MSKTIKEWILETPEPHRFRALLELNHDMKDLVVTTHMEAFCNFRNGNEYQEEDKYWLNVSCGNYKEASKLKPILLATPTIIFKEEKEGAQNHDDGKLDLTLIIGDFPLAYEYLCKLRDSVKDEYPRLNFLESKGTDKESEFLDRSWKSQLRHWVGGMGKDKKSGFYHQAHVALRALINLENLIKEEVEK